MVYQPGKRKLIDGSVGYVTITQNEVMAQIRVDDVGNKVHGNFATIYLKERPKRTNNPLADIVVTGESGALTYRAYPVVSGVLSPTEFTLDFDANMIFLNAAHHEKLFTVVYQGGGGVVDWEKIVDERIIKHADGGFAAAQFGGETDVDGGSANSAYGTEDLLDGGEAHNDMPVYEKIRVRRDTQVAWLATDPIVAQGEIALTLDNGRFKIGTGVKWSLTPYSDAALGFWDAKYIYAVGQFTTLNGRIYKSLMNGNINHTPASSPLWWVEVTGGSGGDPNLIMVDCVSSYPWYLVTKPEVSGNSWSREPIPLHDIYSGGLTPADLIGLRVLVGPSAVDEFAGHEGQIGEITDVIPGDPPNHLFERILGMSGLSRGAYGFFGASDDTLSVFGAETAGSTVVGYIGRTKSSIEGAWIKVTLAELGVSGRVPTNGTYVIVWGSIDPADPTKHIFMTAKEDTDTGIKSLEIFYKSVSDSSPQTPVKIIIDDLHTFDVIRIVNQKLCITYLPTPGTVKAVVYDFVADVTITEGPVTALAGMIPAGYGTVLYDAGTSSYIYYHINSGTEANTVAGIVIAPAIGGTRLFSGLVPALGANCSRLLAGPYENRFFILSNSHTLNGYLTFTTVEHVYIEEFTPTGTPTGRKAEIPFPWPVDPASLKDVWSFVHPTDGPVPAIQQAMLWFDISTTRFHLFGVANGGLLNEGTPGEEDLRNFIGSVTASYRVIDGFPDFSTRSEGGQWSGGEDPTGAEITTASNQGFAIAKPDGLGVAGLYGTGPSWSISGTGMYIEGYWPGTVAPSITWNFSPTTRGKAYLSRAQLEAYELSENGIALARTIAYGGGAAAIPEQRTVYVNVDAAEEIEGALYKTWAAADAYVQTRSPSGTSRWAIGFQSDCSETITHRPFVMLFGHGGWRKLTGKIQSTNIWALPTDDLTVSLSNLMLYDLSPTMPGPSQIKFLWIANCIIYGGTIVQNGTSQRFQFLVDNCTIWDWDFSGDMRGFDGQALKCRIFGGTGYKLQFRDCTISNSIPGVPATPMDINTGSRLYNSRIEMIIDNVTTRFIGTDTLRVYYSTLRSVTTDTFVDLYHSLVEGDLVRAAGTLYAEHTRINGSVTLSGSGTGFLEKCLLRLSPLLSGSALLETRDCYMPAPTITPPATWLNRGATYDNRTTGIPAADLQELADLLVPKGGGIRPLTPYLYQCFFDTALPTPRPIWWTGFSWVDATGAAV